MAYCYCKNCKTHNVAHTTSRIYIEGDYQNIIGKKKYDYYFYRFVCNRCGYHSYRYGNKDDAEQFYPIEPEGESLSNQIPEDIRKDFDEARLVVNYSIRSANVLMRICAEKICNFIAFTFLPNDKDRILDEKLNNKISAIKSKNDKIGLNLKIFDMLKILQHYGNDNAHSIREIHDSDTKESFNILQQFIHNISKSIIEIVNTNNAIDEMNKNMNQ